MSAEHPEHWVLVLRSNVQLVVGNVLGERMPLVAVATTHADALKLAKYLSTSTRRLSPAPLSMYGRTLEATLAKCFEDPKVRGAAFISGWTPDERPVYSVALRDAQTPKPQP